MLVSEKNLQIICSLRLGRLLCSNRSFLPILKLVILFRFEILVFLLPLLAQLPY